MLNPEEIKKLNEVAKPEGFSSERVVYQTTKSLCKSEYYAVFLQRCIEGINRSYRDNIQDRYFIDTDAESIDVWDEDDRTIAFCGNFRDYGTIDQAKEQALIYILEKIK